MATLIKILKKSSIVWTSLSFIYYIIDHWKTRSWIINFSQLAYRAWIWQIIINKDQIMNNNELNGLTN